jgi:hypothetical protein
VAVVQYTFTHKQYTEYRERNIHNNKKKKNWEVRTVPRLCVFYPAFALQLRKKHGKSSVSVVEKCPDFPVAVVQNTFTDKQYTEHNETEYTGRNIHSMIIKVPAVCTTEIAKLLLMYVRSMFYTILLTYPRLIQPSSHISSLTAQ